MIRNILLFSCLVVGGAVLSGASSTPKIMGGVFKSIELIIPYSLNGQMFADPKNKKILSDELKTFAEKSEKISQHFKQEREDLFFLGYALSRDAKEAQKLFENGDYDQARFVLHHITDNCVSCHSKFKSSDKVGNAKIFFSNLKDYKLTGFDLAHYKTVTRQFDAALNKYEQTFSQDRFNLDSMAFGQYLKISLRVKGDPKRVEKFLDGLEKTVSAGSRLHDHIVAWKKSAHAVVKEGLLTKKTVANARDLIGRGTQIQDFYHDSASIVYLMSASAVLNSRLAQKASPSEKSEMYYLLGIIEDKIPQEFWVSETENYLEQSIRIAPRSAWAKKSLGLLEDRFLFDYTGSSGTNLPNDVKKTLKELRDLVNRSRKKA